MCPRPAHPYRRIEAVGSSEEDECPSSQFGLYCLDWAKVRGLFVELTVMSLHVIILPLQGQRVP
jgi:hypothetical protein